ncbi:hypothetical protein IKE71_02840 [Candidatus Saccharibacteria bacterium]|nr:hypothetical protein [Candidatus Saccharibacteria bacterium]
MNDLEYLNQISVKPAPAPAKFFDKKTKLLAIILGAIIFLAIAFLVATSGGSSTSRPDESSELSRVYYQSLSLEETITTYNGKVKSSDLRSYGTTLLTLLTELRQTTGTYLEESLGLKVGEASTNMLPADLEYINETNSALESARLNGILDRKYASELYYQASRLMIFENSAYGETSSESLKSFLSSSYKSLSNVADSLSSFSEAK